MLGRGGGDQFVEMTHGPDLRDGKDLDREEACDDENDKRMEIIREEANVVSLIIDGPIARDPRSLDASDKGVQHHTDR